MSPNLNRSNSRGASHPSISPSSKWCEKCWIVVVVVTAADRRRWRILIRALAFLQSAIGLRCMQIVHTILISHFEYFSRVIRRPSVVVSWVESRQCWAYSQSLHHLHCRHQSDGLWNHTAPSGTQLMRKTAFKKLTAPFHPMRCSEPPY